MVQTGTGRIAAAKGRMYYVGAESNHLEVAAYLPGEPLRENIWSALGLPLLVFLLALTPWPGSTSSNSGLAIQVYFLLLYRLLIPLYRIHSL